MNGYPRFGWVDIVRFRQRARLMTEIDKINHRYGLKTIQIAAEGDKKQSWKVKCDHRSGNYLTDASELLTIRC